ncbi:hypothetical protein ABTY63_24685 [Streptomyces solisilvae]|uniref:hypothetical protein n=1 Tax=Streptomyces malaysiensis TaxID=92644 RepID=UPI0033254A4D
MTGESDAFPWVPAMFSRKCELESGSVSAVPRRALAISPARAERADGVGHSVNKGLSISKDAVAELVIFYVRLRSIKAMTCGCRKLGKSRSNRSSGITVYRGDRKHQFADGRYPVTETVLFHRPDRH